MRYKGHQQSGLNPGTLNTSSQRPGTQALALGSRLTGKGMVTRVEATPEADVGVFSPLSACVQVKTGFNPYSGRPTVHSTAYPPSLMPSEKLSRSEDLAARVVYAALQILKEKGGQAPSKDVFDAVPMKVEFDDWAKHVYETTGKTRWQSKLHFFSIGALKAGYLIKNKGVWYLTPEGEQALELGVVGLHKAAGAAYDDWKAQKNATTEPQGEGDDEDATVPKQEDPKATLDQTQELANTGLKDQINLRNAYEFQDLVAALLRGMGYFTPFVAPKGKDGGIDVIAYRDPLGTVSPRVKVQIKHRKSSASVQEVRQLMGLLQKDGDVGMFVSTGGFTSDAMTTARGSHVHVELVDFDRFITLWQDFYSKVKDEDKALLPLVPVYFYAPPH